MVNDADDAEVAAAITPDLRADLLTALESAIADLEPAPVEQLIAVVGSVVGLIGQDWRPDKQEEFIVLAARELSDLPGQLVLEALARARRRVTEGRRLVWWVSEEVDGRATKLRLECERLTRLAGLATPADG